MRMTRTALSVTVLLSIAVVVYASPMPKAARQAASPSEIMSALTSLLSPTDRISLSDSAASLRKDFDALMASETVDVSPEDLDNLKFSSWLDGDTALRCVEEKIFKQKLQDLFGLFVDALGEKRKARSFLRELYHMSREEVIDGTAARCFTDANYQEMVDLLASFVPKDNSVLYLVMSKAVSGLKPVVVRAASKSTSSLPVALLNGIVRTALDTAAKEKNVELPTSLRAVCPYHYTACCSFYSVPGVPDPQQAYLDCCFNALYAQIASDWETYYADLYPDYTPEEYTLLYCLLPSV